MQKTISTVLVLVSISLANGCDGAYRGEEFRSRESASREDTVANRKSRADRIFPEDGDFTGAHIEALIEAIRTVRPDIPKEELPLNGNAVRHVLQGMSVRDLDRVEAILPRIIKRRQTRGAN